MVPGCCVGGRPRPSWPAAVMVACRGHGGVPRRVARVMRVGTGRGCCPMPGRCCPRRRQLRRSSHQERRPAEMISGRWRLGDLVHSPSSESTLDHLRRARHRTAELTVSTGAVDRGIQKRTERPVIRIRQGTHRGCDRSSPRGGRRGGAGLGQVAVRARRNSTPSCPTRGRACSRCVRPGSAGTLVESAAVQCLRAGLGQRVGERPRRLVDHPCVDGEEAGGLRRRRATVGL
jgi:hypothetical protein